MPKQVLGLALLCGSVLLPHLASAHEGADEQFFVSIKIGETTVDGAQQKVRADPTIVVKLDQPFSIHTGGLITPKTGGEEMEIGLRVSGTLRRTEEGSIQARLKITQADYKWSDPATDLVMTESVEVQTLLTPGQTKRLDLGGARWCEIRTEEADLPALGQQQPDLAEGDLVTVVFSDQESLFARDARAGADGSAPYQLTARVVKTLPGEVCEIEANQKTVQDGVQRSVSLTGRVPSASVSEGRVVPTSAIANLRIATREE